MSCAAAEAALTIAEDIVCFTDACKLLASFLRRVCIWMVLQSQPAEPAVAARYIELPYRDAMPAVAACLLMFITGARMPKAA